MVDFSAVTGGCKGSSWGENILGSGINKCKSPEGGASNGSPSVSVFASVKLGWLYLLCNIEGAGGRLRSVVVSMAIPLCRNISLLHGVCPTAR